VTRARFTRRQRLVLTALGAAVVLVFGLLGFSIAATLQQFLLPTSQPPDGSPILSPLGTPTSPPGSPTPLSSPSPTVTRPAALTQIQSARAVQEIGRIVAGLRELPPVEQIPVTFPTVHEMTIDLLQRYQEERPQDGLGLYVFLGLIPELDPLPLPDVTAQAAHISSLYVQGDQQIRLVTGRGPTTPDDELALVRALTTALQDQQFDLATLAPCLATTDARLALDALVEGDPVFVTALYGGVEAGEEEMNRLAQMAADAEVPSFAPLAAETAFQRLRLFPYQEGARFVAAVYGDGGWTAVNRAYARLPCSTEQVLHPERYLERTPPQEVTVPDLGDELGDGWGLVLQDTLGEFLTGLHLASYLDDDAVAWEAADGWAGDTFVVWQNDDGRQVLVWRSAWDERSEAEALEHAVALLVPRFRTPPLIAGNVPIGLRGRFWSGPAGAAYLSRSGRVVTVVWGPDADTVAAVAAAMP